MSRFTLGVCIVVGWLFLWGDISVANVVGGAAVVGVLFLVFPSDRGVRPRLMPRLLAVGALVAHVARDLVVSNARLAAELLRRRRSIRSAVVTVPLRTGSPSLLTAVCNLAALSPGTLIVGVEPGPVLVVHVLVFGDGEDPDDAIRSILQLEDRVVRAFGSEVAA